MPLEARQVKTCSTCKKSRMLVCFSPDRRYRYGVSGRCRTCNNARVREWKRCSRKKVAGHNLKYVSENREKIRAHGYLGWAISIGKVVKPDRGETCDKRASLDGHHEYYSRPLEVKWLCRQCHVDVHNGIVR